MEVNVGGATWPAPDEWLTWSNLQTPGTYTVVAFGYPSGCSTTMNSSVTLSAPTVYILYQHPALVQDLL